MTRRIQISGGLLASLLTIFGEGSQILYLPSALFKVVGQEAWLAMFLGNAGGSLVGLLGIAACMRYPGLMPGQIARRALGKWLGGAVSLLYGAFFVWIYILVLRDLLDFAQIVLLPETPVWVLCLLVILPVLYMSWEGLEPIARVCFAIFVVKGLSVLLIPLLVSKEYSRLQLDPFLYHGWGALLRSVGEVVPWSVECLIVMSLVPNLRRGAKAYRWFALGMAGATAIVALLMIPTALAFGPDLAARFTYPVYALVQMIMIGRTIERIEMVLVIIWLFGILIKMCLCLYAGAAAWSHAFGDDSRYRKAAILATSIGALLTALWSGPLDLMAMTRTRVWSLGTIAVAVGLPLLLWLASLRHRKASPQQGDLNA